MFHVKHELFIDCVNYANYTYSVIYTQRAIVMTDTTNTGNITLDDVRAALGDTAPSSTNAGALRRVLGRGSLSTIQKHLDTIRAEGAAPALELAGAAPAAPSDLVAAVWSAAWAAAQARTMGALAQAQAQVAQQAQALAVAQADAAAAQEQADQVAQALEQAQQEQTQQQEGAAQAQDAAQAQAQAQQAAAAQELATVRQELATAQQVQELERAQHAAVAATLRGEVDRLVSQLADLRAALGKNAE